RRSGAFGTRRATRGGPGGPGTNGPGTNGPGTSGRGERPGHERPGRTGGASDRGDPATAARTRYTSRVLPANRPAVYADLLALPDGERGEVLAGEIVVSPAALPRHARAQGALGRFIGGPYDYDGGGPGGWWILPEVDVRFAEHDILRPDLAGWRRERLLDPWGTRPIDTIPDWVCEVVSPSNAAVDRVVKRRLYARHGV